MRVVLRQPGSEHYLQPSGEWAPSRDTARYFLTAVAAYFWALEQKLVGAEVCLAYSDPKKDFACMRLPSPGKRPVIDCNHADWNKALHSLLFHGVEVDLVNFEYAKHGQSCELLSQASAMEFSPNRDPEAKAAQVRKKGEERI